MTQRRHAKDASPVVELLARCSEAFPNLIGQVCASGDDVEHPGREFHDAERVLESTMRGARIDEVGERQLMDVPQTLERSGVEDLSLGAIQAHEDVNRIPDLVYVLRHGPANNER